MRAFEYTGNIPLDNLADATPEMIDSALDPARCGEHSPTGFLCTQPRHHSTEHIATTPAELDLAAKIVAVWTDEPDQ